MLPSRSLPRSKRMATYNLSARSSARRRHEGTIVASARSVPERDWRTSTSLIGLAEFHPELKRTTLEGRVAGLDRVSNAYHEQGYLFPRFERQKIRALYDDDLLTGNKAPEKQILRMIPCKLKPIRPPESTPPDSVRSMSTNSAGTSRSAKSTARSVRSNTTSLGSNWVQQHRLDPDFQWKRYSTHNNDYGKGCKSDPYLHLQPGEPGRGRENFMWMTRQHPSRQNCLTTNHLYNPMLRSARGPLG